MNQGPPYRPTTWSLGGQAKANVDIPITAVFLVLYIIGAIAHMTIFQRNMRRGHKFLFSAFLFGFCMSRIVTTVLRIASATRPTNLRLAIAAQIFVAAGVVLIFIINLFWAQRIVRSLHPRIGWHSASSLVLKALITLIIFVLAIVITATVQNFYTLRPRTKKIDRNLQIFGTFFMAIVAFLPIPILLVSVLTKSRKSTPDRFGHGRLRTKIIVLLVGSTLLCLGASYRCATLWLPPVPRTHPLPPYFHRACFYAFNFVIEILVIYIYAIARVDLRFHVPNGSHGSFDAPQSYSDTTNSDVDTGRAIQEAKETEETLYPASDASNPALTETGLKALPLALRNDSVSKDSSKGSV